MKKEYDFSKGKRGPVIPRTPGKTRITIRLDDDVLEWFRSQVHAAGGGNYQSLINGALREYMASVREPLETCLRRVVREELGVYTVTPKEPRSAKRRSAHAGARTDFRPRRGGQARSS